MKIGGFYEHQLPRPWIRESEHQLFKDALDQVELADKLGFETPGYRLSACVRTLSTESQDTG